MPSVFILGTRIDNVGMERALTRVGELLSAGAGHYIVTPNPEILLKASRDETLRAILNGAALSLCDGIGAYLAALCMGKHLTSRVPGVDFMEALCVYAAPRNIRVALIGGEREVRAKVQETLCNQNSGLNIVMAEDDAHAERLSADIALVAFGSPKQEYWMAEQASKRTFKVMVGVGGAFDMISGRRKRAPKIMRRMGVEWAWRLVLEPQRAGRIVSAVIVFPAVLLRSILSS